jgi:hypothetical protein
MADLHARTGLNQLNRPRFIDQGTYDKLMKIDFKAYEEHLLKTLRNDTVAVDSAMVRLDEAQKLATSLRNAGRVVETWDDAGIDKYYAGHKISEEKKVKSDSYDGSYERLGFYARDWVGRI